MPEQTVDPRPEKKMKVETKAMIAYLITGLIAGTASWGVVRLLLEDRGSFAALAIAILLLVGLPQLLKKPLGVTQKFKWWLSNGGWIYILVWFISWIMLLNLFPVPKL
jgi:hypothetical protein